MSDQPQREMTLEEYVARLGPNHLAFREYQALKAAIPRVGDPRDRVLGPNRDAPHSACIAREERLYERMRGLVAIATERYERIQDLVKLTEANKRIQELEEASPEVVQEHCRCGHSKSAHIYEEGACRPGFQCETSCEKFTPSSAICGYCGKLGEIVFIDERNEMTIPTCESCYAGPSVTKGEGEEV